MMAGAQRYLGLPYTFWTTATSRQSLCFENIIEYSFLIMFTRNGTFCHTR